MSSGRTRGKEGQHVEPMLAPTPDRLTMFPVRRPDLWEMYKKQVASFWTAEEIQAALGNGRDREDYKRLKPAERDFLDHVLAFFAAADGIVVENCARKFLCEVQWPEARAFYGFQTAMEGIHGEVYSLLITSLVEEAGRQQVLLDAVTTMPCVERKAQWALKWMESRKSFAHRLVAFACLEGVAFSAAFACIFWLRHRGHGFPAVLLANEFIARDEGLHADFACLLYRHLEAPLPEKEARAIVEGCVEVEYQFVEEALPEGLVGMNKAQLTQYVEFCADRLLRALGHAKPLYGVANPFAWMELISISTSKTNFFEREVSNYRMKGVGQDIKEQAFTVEADF